MTEETVQVLLRLAEEFERRAGCEPHEDALGLASDYWLAAATLCRQKATETDEPAQPDTPSVGDQLEGLGKVLHDLASIIGRARVTHRGDRDLDEASAAVGDLRNLYYDLCRQEATKGEPFAEIDADELEEARANPAIQALHAAADRHMATLKAEGRIEEPCEWCHGRGWFRRMPDVGQPMRPAVECDRCRGTGIRATKGEG